MKNVALYEIFGAQHCAQLITLTILSSACPSAGEEENNITEVENMDALYPMAKWEVVPTAPTPLNTRFGTDIGDADSQVHK